MNPKLSPLFSRRSVRTYTDGQITDACIQDLLEAAMAAPSAVAKDPWHFIVIRDRQKRNLMADALPNGQMLRTAPVAILVCGDIAKTHGGDLSYLLQDCSAAIENLLLAASMLGLGGCWLGVHPREERITALTSLFKLPANIIPVSAIALGVPSAKPEPRTRFNPAAVHPETW
jgi:nitroreductase